VLFKRERSGREVQVNVLREADLQQAIPYTLRPMWIVIAGQSSYLGA
jgi:hypothetical protein